MSMAKRAKQKAAFGLDMDPDEFLERAIRTKPSEVEELPHTNRENHYMREYRAPRHRAKQ